MTTRFDRRKLLKRTAVAACGAAVGTRLFGVPAVLAQASPNSKVAAVVLSCYNQATASINELARLDERILAFADTDDRQYKKAHDFLAKNHPKVNFDAIQKFSDYRQMLDKLQKQIDVVFVCIPGSSPCHGVDDGHEARQAGLLRKAPGPLDPGVPRRWPRRPRSTRSSPSWATRGTANDGIRRLCEYIWAGAIGNVTEVHVWAPTGRGGTGGRPATQPVPAGVHWDEWIGPAAVPRLSCRSPSRPLAELVGVRRRLAGRLGLPQYGRTVLGPQSRPTDQRRAGRPRRRERRAIPAGQRHPLRLPRPREAAAGQGLLVRRLPRGRRPPIPRRSSARKRKKRCSRPRTARPLSLDLEKKYARKFGDGGAVFVGDKGIIVAGNYCESPRIVPEEKHQAFTPPDRTLPRIKGTHQQNFLTAVK